MNSSSSPSRYVLGLVIHPTKDTSASVADVLTWASEVDAAVVGLATDAGRLPEAVELLEPHAFAARVDAVSALGGDGTLLGAMRRLVDRPVPVLGVNYGNVGFLVEVEPRDLRSALDALHRGEFTLEPHHALEVTIGEATHLAFNDVSLARTPGSGAVNADLAVGDVPYGYYKADAVIVSTPAGSTAYNYAAGGPVLSPSIAALVVTPVAPMTGIDRAVVLGERETVRLSLLERTTRVAVEVDGQVVAELHGETIVDVRLRAEAGVIVRLDAAKHGARGRLKLSLLDLPLRQDQLLELIPQHVRDRMEEFRAGL